MKRAAIAAGVVVGAVVGAGALVRLGEFFARTAATPEFYGFVLVSAAVAGCFGAVIYFVEGKP